MELTTAILSTALAVFNCFRGRIWDFFSSSPNYFCIFSRQAVIFQEKTPISPLKDGRNVETCERNPIIPPHPNERKSNSFEHHSKGAWD